MMCCFTRYRLFLATIFVTSFFVFLIPAQAATLYVGTSGTDQVGCGSSQGASACRTIGYAATAASSGDTISVGAGTYNGYLSFGAIFGKNLIFDGNNAATLTHTASNGAEAIVDIGSGQTSATVIRNFILSCGGGEVAHPAINITNTTPIIQGNTISGCSNGVAVNNNSGTVIMRNNTVQTGSSVGIAFRGGGTGIIDSNIVSGTTGSAAMSLKNGTYHVINNVLYNTVASNVDAAGIMVQDIAGEGNNVTAVIVNNTLDGNWPLSLTDTQNGAGTVTVYHKNNISVNSGADIVINDFIGDSANLISDYNFYDAFFATRVGVTSYSSMAAWRNATDDDDNSVVSSDGASFNNSSNRDYTLRTSSLAIGRGTDDIVGTNDLATYSAHVDFADNPRPAVVSSTTTLVDIGAYENQSVGEIQSITLSAGTTTLSGNTTSTPLTITANFNVGPATTLTSEANVNIGNTGIIIVSQGFSAPGKIAYGMGTGSSSLAATYGPLTSNSININTSGLPAYAQIYVDATNGNDTTGTGTQNAPFKTTEKADQEISGDPASAPRRVYLKGTFSNQKLDLDSDQGSNGNGDLWITSWPGQIATIDATGTDDTAIQISGADYVTVQGLTIIGEDNDGITIEGASENITINGNTIRGSSAGITHNGTGGSNTVTLSKNTIYNNASAGIVLNGSNNATVFNNLIYGHPNGLGIGFVGTSAGIAIWNNTLVNNGGGGIAAYNVGYGNPTITNLTAKNNLIAQATAGYAAPVKIISTVNTGMGNNFNYNLYHTTNNIPLVTMDSNTYSTLAAWQAASAHDDNSVNSDPLFTNAGSNDYTLQATSPAINVGTSSGAPSGAMQDIVGLTRNSVYDIGAYETTVEPVTSSARHSGGSDNGGGGGTDSGGDGSTDADAGGESSGDTPPANLRRGMDSFASLLRLIRFTAGLPIEARVADYVDFNADSAFDLQDLRAFLNYLRGRR